MDFRPLLCLSATPLELQPLHDALSFAPVGDGAFPLYYAAAQDIFLLHTGIAKVNTAYSVARAITQLKLKEKIKIRTVLQCGIGGSFTPEHAIGEVLLASSEMDMDAGIRYQNNWQGIETLGFSLVNSYANTISDNLCNKLSRKDGVETATNSDENGIKAERLYEVCFRNWYNQLPTDNHWTDYLTQKLQLQCVPFATSDAITGDKEQARRQQQYSKASIESMEGSAAAQVCQHFQLPFAEMRSISNYVGVRDKNLWNIPLAIKNLNHYTLKIITMLD